MDIPGAIALTRVGVGVGAYAAPRLGLRVLTFDARAPQSPSRIRLFALRDAALGLATLSAHGPARSRLARLGMVADAGDAVAGLLALRSGGTPRPVGAVLALAGAGAVVAGVVTPSEPAGPGGGAAADPEEVARVGLSAASFALPLLALRLAFLDPTSPQAAFLSRLVAGRDLALALGAAGVGTSSSLLGGDPTGRARLTARRATVAVDVADALTVLVEVRAGRLPTRVGLLQAALSAASAATGWWGLRGGAVSQGTR